ncbi:hypothetical protein ACSUEI_24340, partial [Serratia marcescens]|uniref:hypothetical protein n=1 Tax=Serratia marcescens TaxID=615 RepID=UPI003F430217
DMLHQHQVTPLLTLRYLQYLCELTQRCCAQLVAAVAESFRGCAHNRRPPNDSAICTLALATG